MSTEAKTSSPYPPEQLIVNFERYYRDALEISEPAEREKELENLQQELSAFMKEHTLENNSNLKNLLENIRQSIKEPDFKPPENKKEDKKSTPSDDADFEDNEYGYPETLPSSSSVILMGLDFKLPEKKEKKEATKELTQFIRTFFTIARKTTDQNGVDELIRLFLDNPEILGAFLNESLDGYRPGPKTTRITAMHKIMALRPSRRMDGVFSKLLASGNKLSLLDQHGNTPLHLFMKGCPDNTIPSSEIVSAPDFTRAMNAQNTDGMTPLIVGFVKSPDDAMKVLRAIPAEKINQIEFNARDCMGKTALHYAAALSYESDWGNEVVALLEKCDKDKIDINAQDREGLTPAMIALQHGKIASVRALLNRPEFDYAKQDVKRSSLLHHAEARLQTLSPWSNPIDYPALSSLIEQIKTRSAAQAENNTQENKETPATPGGTGRKP